MPVWIRHESDSVADLLRVVGAGLLAGSELRISLATEPSPEVAAVLGTAYVVEDGPAWCAALAGLASGRVRLIGGSPERFAEDSAGRPELALYAQPVVEAGRIELLTFLREQAVAVTAHRFGSPTPLVAGLREPGR